MSLQLFQAIERRPATILELGDHRRRCFVVLLRADAFRYLSREDLSACSAAQSFQRVDRGRQRRLSDDPHQYFGLFLPVDIALPTLRTPITVLQRLMRNVHLLRSSEGIGAVAPM